MPQTATFFGGSGLNPWPCGGSVPGVSIPYKEATQVQIQEKQSAGWRNADGTVVPPHTLYRYVDESGKGGCWYASIENARRSWDRRKAAA
jgi:hypothetical protein